MSAEEKTTDETSETASDPEDVTNAAQDNSSAETSKENAATGEATPYDVTFAGINSVN